MTPTERGKGQRKRFEFTVLGRPLISVTSTSEQFDLKRLPKYVEAEMIKKKIPPELMQDSLAIIGRAYSDAAVLWGDRMSDIPDLTFQVPTPDDFETALERVKSGVGVDQLVKLSEDLFGHSDTPKELVGTVENQITLLFEGVKS